MMKNHQKLLKMENPHNLNCSSSEDGLVAKIQDIYTKIAPVEHEEHIWQELLKAAGKLYHEISPLIPGASEGKYTQF